MRGTKAAEKYYFSNLAQRLVNVDHTISDITSTTADIPNDLLRDFNKDLLIEQVKDLRRISPTLGGPEKEKSQMTYASMLAMLLEKGMNVSDLETLFGNTKTPAAAETTAPHSDTTNLTLEVKSMTRSQTPGTDPVKATTVKSTAEEVEFKSYRDLLTSLKFDADLNIQIEFLFAEHFWNDPIIPQNTKTFIDTVESVMSVYAQQKQLLPSLSTLKIALEHLASKSKPVLPVPTDSTSLTYTYVDKKQRHVQETVFASVADELKAIDEEEAVMVAAGLVAPASLLPTLPVSSALKSHAKQAVMHVATDDIFEDIIQNNIHLLGTPVETIDPSEQHVFAEPTPHLVLNPDVSRDVVLSNKTQVGHIQYQMSRNYQEDTATFFTIPASVPDHVYHELIAILNANCRKFNPDRLGTTGTTYTILESSLNNGILANKVCFIGDSHAIRIKYPKNNQVSTTVLNPKTHTPDPKINLDEYTDIKNRATIDPLYVIDSIRVGRLPRIINGMHSHGLNMSRSIGDFLHDDTGHSTQAEILQISEEVADDDIVLTGVMSDFFIRTNALFPIKDMELRITNLIQLNWPTQAEFKKFLESEPDALTTLSNMLVIDAYDAHGGAGKSIHHDNSSVVLARPTAGRTIQIIADGHGDTNIKDANGKTAGAIASNSAVNQAKSLLPFLLKKDRLRNELKTMKLSEVGLLTPDTELAKIAQGLKDNIPGLDELKCDINSKDSTTGYTLLHHAVATRNVALVIKLINGNIKTATVNQATQDNQGRTALHLAILLGAQDIISYLSSDPRTLQTEDALGLTPCQLALCMHELNKQDPVFRSIAETVVNKTLIHCPKPNVPSVKGYQFKGLKPGEEKRSGYGNFKPTNTNPASIENYDEIFVMDPSIKILADVIKQSNDNVKLLETELAKWDTRDESSIINPETMQDLLMVAVKANKYLTAQWLIKKLTDFNSEEATLDFTDEKQDSRSLMHFAALTGNLRLVQLLAYQGAPCNTEDDNGLTPIAIALDAGHVDIANFLLQDTNLKSPGTLRVQYAKSNQSSEQKRPSSAGIEGQNKIHKSRPGSLPDLAKAIIPKSSDKTTAKSNSSETKPSVSSANVSSTSAPAAAATSVTAATFAAKKPAGNADFKAAFLAHKAKMAAAKAGAKAPQEVKQPATSLAATTIAQQPVAPAAAATTTVQQTTLVNAEPTVVPVSSIVMASESATAPAVAVPAFPRLNGQFGQFALLPPVAPVPTAVAIPEVDMMDVDILDQPALK